MDSLKATIYRYRPDLKKEDIRSAVPIPSEEEWKRNPAIDMDDMDEIEHGDSKSMLDNLEMYEYWRDDSFDPTGW